MYFLWDYLEAFFYSLQNKNETCGIDPTKLQSPVGAVKEEKCLLLCGQLVRCISGREDQQTQYDGH